MNRPRLSGGQLAAAVVAAALLLGVATTGLLAATGTLRPTSARCAVPALPGQAVDVTAVDMGGGMMGGDSGPFPMGMMRLLTHPGTVATGTVSLRVVNAGVRAHEVVVLPLRPGQPVGGRAVAADGKVKESGSLGEASRSCDGGAGEGIAAGSAGWTTLTLPPGRYELLCNLPWHYSAGIYAELDVPER